MPRLLNAAASDFAAMTKRELIEAIAQSEGRTLVAETVVAAAPAVGGVTNPELAAAMGADILLLNFFDVENPQVQGLPPHEPQETIRLLKRLTGRPVGINLEPAEEEVGGTGWGALAPGAQATAANAVRAADMGVDLILVTGNPGHGVTNEGVLAALREIHAAAGERVVLAAGRMHCSGVLAQASENIMSEADIQAFAAAGADIILLPAPGTVPGITLELARALVVQIHAAGKLACTAVGTSQEGADEQTIRSIALMAKQCGTDIHHIGDTGISGIALPQNIMAYSIAIRGIQHTYRRMALSPNR